MLAAGASRGARLNDDRLALPAGAQLTLAFAADRPRSMATLGDQDLVRHEFLKRLHARYTREGMTVVPAHAAAGGS